MPVEIFIVIDFRKKKLCIPVIWKYNIYASFLLNEFIDSSE